MNVKGVRRCLVSALVCVVGSCAGTGQILLVPEKTEVNSEVRLPLRLIQGMPLVQASVNGKGPFWFLVDTGSTGCFINTPLADSLQDSGRGGSARLKASSGQVRETGMYLTLRSIRLGEASFQGVVAVRLDLTSIQEALNIALGGILGVLVFRDCLLTLDYPGRELVLRPYSYARPAGEEVELIWALDALPRVRATLSGVEREFLVDSGAGGFLFLPFDAESVLRFKAAPVEGPKVRVVEGDERTRVGRLDGMFEIGPHKVLDPIAYLTSREAILGADFLRHFEVTIDQERSCVLFRRGEAGPIRVPPKRTTGLAFIRKAHTWIIIAVIPESPASNLDLREADQVIAVEGRPAAEVDAPTWKRLLDSRKNITLRIRRGADERDVRVPIIVLVP